MNWKLHWIFPYWDRISIIREIYAVRVSHKFRFRRPWMIFDSNSETRFREALKERTMDIDFDDFSSYANDSSSPLLIPHLQKSWISERSAPDILPYETRLLESISTRLKEQVSNPFSPTLPIPSQLHVPLDPWRSAVAAFLKLAEYSYWFWTGTDVDRFPGSRKNCWANMTVNAPSESSSFKPK